MVLKKKKKKKNRTYKNIRSKYFENILLKQHF